MQASVTKKTVNASQKECIETIDGKLMVLAGPGTGKTFVLIERIKNMLAKNVLPEKVLCLTFSVAAAKEMKKRLVKDCGNWASAITVNTFHGFCSELIKNYPEKFNLPQNVKIITETIAKDFIKQIIDVFKPKFYRDKWGNAYGEIDTLYKSINELKKHQTQKEIYLNDIETKFIPKLEELQDLHEQKLQEGKPDVTRKREIEALITKIGKSKELWEIYELYSQKMFSKGFIDFNDMINLVLENFANDQAFIVDVSKKYTHFLVDEYQDTSELQNKIVFELVDNNELNNLFVVGDDDQIIYGFQGARLDNLEKFLQKYPDTKVICLTQNYRSTQPILDLGHKLIEQDLTRLEVNPNFVQYKIDKKLTSNNPNLVDKASKVRLCSFDENLQEYNFIVDEIADLIDSEHCPTGEAGEKLYSEIAVLSAKNADLDKFAEMFNARNIPYQIEKGRSIFAVMSTLLTYFYMQVLVNNRLYSDKLFFMLQAEPFNFNKSDYVFLLEKNRLNHEDFLTNMQNNINYEWKEPEKIKKFLDTFNYLCGIKANENLKTILVEIINRTGILSYYLNNPICKSDNILGLKALIDEADFQEQINPSITLNDFVTYLSAAFEGDIPILISKDTQTKNAVQLLTLHGSKGCEFEYVYMPNLTKSRCQKTLKSDFQLIKRDFREKEEREQTQKAEELKILYVGVTRAKHSLTLSCSLAENGKPQELVGYFAAVPDFDFEKHYFNLTSESYLSEIAKSFEKKSKDYDVEFQHELQECVNSFQFSPTSLDTYISCPRQFLYSRILKINVKTSNWDTPNYGTAFHSVLEKIVKIKNETGETLSLEKTQLLFKDELDKVMISSKMKRDELHERGIKSIQKYYPHFINDNLSNICNTEWSFDDILIEGIPIKGKIDRIQKNIDGSYSLYDYKTGTAKTPKQISDDGDYEKYLNQLRFYQVAFQKSHGNVEIAEVGLLFVEEHEKSFRTKLTEEDTKIIVTKLKNAHEKILNLDFQANPKNGERTCKYCPYQNACSLNVL